MTWLGIRKFFKYALIVALADTLPVLIKFLDGAELLSQVDWGTCFDASGLVFVKALIGGSLGALINLVGARKKPVA